ncbi:MAG TPA: efflux RND transporter periplasmic adaptor subunit [Thermoanaerobaculia bacterium]
MACEPPQPRLRTPDGTVMVDKASLDSLRIDRREEPRMRPLAWAAGALVVLAVVALAAWAFVRPDAIPVRTAAVAERRVGGGATVLNASGYVTARRQATVSSKVTGKVVDVRVEEGMTVREGDILARLDDSRTSAELRLAEAQAVAAASAVEELRVRVAEAALDLDRAKHLLDTKVGSQADFDRANAQLDALRARHRATADNLTVAQRTVRLRQQDLDDLVIRAPFSGVVISKNAQPGEMISPMSAGGGFTRTGICTIVDMASLEVEVDVNEAYITRVRPGQPVEIVLDAYPEWKIPGHVIAIVPAADRQKATVRVRLGFDQSDPRILPDMGAKVAFRAEGGEAEVERIIPRAALVRQGDRDTVFVVKGAIVEKRAITVGSASGDEVGVLGGLNVGERVVLGPPAGLEDGATVRVMEGERDE